MSPIPCVRPGQDSSNRVAVQFLTLPSTGGQVIRCLGYQCPGKLVSSLQNPKTEGKQEGSRKQQTRKCAQVVQNQGSIFGILIEAKSKKNIPIFVNKT